MKKRYKSHLDIVDSSKIHDVFDYVVNWENLSSRFRLWPYMMDADVISRG